MTWIIACPECGAELRLKPEWVGRRATCNRCQNPILISDPTSLPSPSDAREVPSSPPPETRQKKSAKRSPRVPTQSSRRLPPKTKRTKKRWRRLGTPEAPGLDELTFPHISRDTVFTTIYQGSFLGFKFGDSLKITPATMSMFLQHPEVRSQFLDSVATRLSPQQLFDLTRAKSHDGETWGELSTRLGIDSALLNNLAHAIVTDSWQLAFATSLLHNLGGSAKVARAIGDPKATVVGNRKSYQLSITDQVRDAFREIPSVRSAI